jgi:hypothetical protein
MYNTEVLLLVFALLVNTPLLECGRSYLRLQEPSIQIAQHALRPESSSSLLPSGLAHQHQRTGHPAVDVSLAAHKSNPQQPHGAWQVADNVAQPLRRKHQHPTVHSMGRRRLLFVWMPTWTESDDDTDSSGSSSNSDSGSSEDTSSSSSSIQAASTRSAEAPPAPTEGCSVKTGRTFYAQLRVLLAMNVTHEDGNSLSALEANVSGVYEAALP